MSIKTYAVALKKHPERYEYIKQHLTDRALDFEVVDAVDGSLLTDEQKAKECDMAVVNSARWWLTDGALGAALSHFNCLKKISGSEDKAGFIVEDDVILPEDISETLVELEQKIAPDEVILLFSAFSRPTRLSTIGKEPVRSGDLLYPIDINSVMSAVAYVIGKEAAQGMVDVIKPIKVPADCWYRFYEQGAFRTLRILYPNQIEVTHIKSSIDYIDRKSFKSKLSHFINDNKIPFIFSYLKKSRQKRLDSLKADHQLVDEPSPLQRRRSE